MLLIFWRVSNVGNPVKVQWTNMAVAYNFNITCYASCMAGWVFKIKLQGIFAQRECRKLLKDFDHYFEKRNDFFLFNKKDERKEFWHCKPISQNSAFIVGTFMLKDEHSCKRIFVSLSQINLKLSARVTNVTRAFERNCRL